jgi:hypothetical protein
MNYLENYLEKTNYSFVSGEALAFVPRLLSGPGPSSQRAASLVGIHPTLQGWSNPRGPDLQKLTCPRVGTHALIRLLTLLRQERSTVANNRSFAARHLQLGLGNTNGSGFHPNAKGI